MKSIARIRAIVAAAARAPPALHRASRIATCAHWGMGIARQSNCMSEHSSRQRLGADLRLSLSAWHDV